MKQLTLEDTALMAVTNLGVNPDEMSMEEATFALLVESARAYVEAILNESSDAFEASDGVMRPAYDLEKVAHTTMTGVIQSLEENLEQYEAVVDPRHLDIILRRK